MTHTPGPWIAMPHKDNSRRFQVRGPDPDGCGSSPISYFVCENAKRDNAILIAAAPELLAALTELVHYDDGSSEPGAYGHEVLGRCKSAIAKAEGRTT